MGRFRLHYKNKPYRLLGRARHSESLEMVTLYECLYPNDLGTLWVRPEGMFHEDVELNGKKIGRFRAVPLEIRSEEKMTEEIWAAMGPLAQKIFGEKCTRAYVEERIGSKKALYQVGFFEGDAVGFKIGYMEDDGFYGWLGGVREDRRNVGVATDLSIAQQQWAFDRGARVLRTKSRNGWTDMIVLNLRQGFKITGTEPGDGGLKILFEKPLDVRPKAPQN